MMRDLGVEKGGVVYADSSAALAVAKRKGASKLRHINISCLWNQEIQGTKQLELRKVLGPENPADMMTKHLPRQPLDKCMGQLNQTRAQGRAKAGLDVQGKGQIGSDPTPSPGAEVGNDTGPAQPKDRMKTDQSSHESSPSAARNPSDTLTRSNRGPSEGKTKCASVGAIKSAGAGTLLCSLRVCTSGPSYAPCHTHDEKADQAVIFRGGRQRHDKPCTENIGETRESTCPPTGWPVGGVYYTCRSRSDVNKVTKDAEPTTSPGAVVGLSLIHI